MLVGAGTIGDFIPVIVAERSALEAHARALPSVDLERLLPVSGDSRAEIGQLTASDVALVDPVGTPRGLVPGRPGRADAEGAFAALDRAVELMEAGIGDALVTGPLSKAEIAHGPRPGFVGHTDELAHRAGLDRYGRDYLMCFLAPDLKVALLSTHLPLRDAIAGLDERSIVDALECLHRHAPGSIALAGLNPHAGEGGLLGSEDGEILAPAVVQARSRGIDVVGPLSADSLFARARRGEFDWVLALYHDQGLVAVKTAAFGSATNWTLGLPYLRTSVDHGTAYDVAGRGVADEAPLRAVVETTLELIRCRPASRAGPGRK